MKVYFRKPWTGGPQLGGGFTAGIAGGFASSLRTGELDGFAFSKNGKKGCETQTDDHQVMFS